MKPWEKYQSSQSGPWSKYSGSNRVQQEQPYTYGQAISDTGKTAIKSFGEDMLRPAFDALTHPIQTVKGMASAVSHPIQTGRAVGGYLKENYGSQEKLANTVSQHPFRFVGDVATAAGIAGGFRPRNFPMTTQAVKAGGRISAKIGQETIQGIKNIPKAIPQTVNKVTAPIRDYAGNKILSTRKGMVDYWKQETDAYGNSLKELSNVPDKVALEPVMENMTKLAVERRLYNPETEKWLSPLNKVDAQFIRAYKTIAREYTAKGESTVGKVIRQYQTIKDSAEATTPLGRDARILANQIIEGMKDQINVPAFKQANLRYSDFRNTFDAINNKIDVWGNSLKTGKGENFLTRGLSQTKESRRIGQKITEVTGQTLKGAKLLNAIRSLPGMKFLSR